MKRARRFFSPEFKAEAVKLIKERGYSVSQACRELDIGETALRRWISQVEAENQGYILDLVNHQKWKVFIASIRVSSIFPPTIREIVLTFVIRL